MKKTPILIAVIILGMTISNLNAQLPQLSTENQKVNAASLLTQLTNAIKPSSFLENWASGKSGWLSKAAKAVNPSAIASSVSSLAGFIKPGMFKNGFSLQNLQKAASAAKTMNDASGLLKNFESGLKPEAMNDSWAGKRNSWLGALNLIK
jgi:hypothetical protein